ncbi:MAG TPA: hypothetical protein VGN84_07520 [Solirubrobacterales bacterium]|jgi:hypothetical protein|nr:hypothetical protein [Solirubrobacterales bacterium]
MYRLSALLAVIAAMATSAFGAGVAHAEEPYWKVNGTRLGKGETKKFVWSGGESYVLSSTWHGSEFSIKCTEAVVQSGAVIIGSAAEQTATDEATTALLHCTKTQVGFNCWIDAEEIIFNKAISHPATRLNGTMTLVVEVFLPTQSTKKVTSIRALGQGCWEEEPEASIEGTYAGEFRVSGTGVEVGKEAEALSPEIAFPKEQIKAVTLKGAELKIGLTLEGNPVTIEGRSNMKLLSGEKFGIWTK